MTFSIRDYKTLFVLPYDEKYTDDADTLRCGYNQFTCSVTPVGLSMSTEVMWCKQVHTDLYSVRYGSMCLT